MCLFMSPVFFLEVCLGVFPALFDLDFGVLVVVVGCLFPTLALTTPPIMLCELKFNELEFGLISTFERMSTVEFELS